MSAAMDLMGIAEIAELFGVTRQAVTNWSKRWPDFPKPVAELKCGPIWIRAQMTQWRKKKSP